jgi:hypothetical protein
MIIQKYNTEIPKHKKKRANTQKYSNPPLLKGFKKFFIDGPCELSLKARQLNGLWLITIQL